MTVDLFTLLLLGGGLFFGWALGANDSANVFGTAVGTRMLRFRTAAILCSGGVILGAVISGAGPTETLGKLAAIKSVAEAIQYGIELIGAKHVALGSDFDGAVLPGFDSSELIAITHELLEAGVEESDIRLVMGENMFNYLKKNLAN